MIDKFIETILQWLLSVFQNESIVVVLIAILPIVEARLAIPIALSYNISPLPAWLLSFLGSTLIAPILLLVLIPFIKWLASTKLFKKVGTVIYEKFEKKSQGLKKESEQPNSNDWKKMLGVFIFVAIPLPLTGVWTGCAVASIVGLKYWKSLVAITLGNLVASGIILILSVFFADYINYIILALGIIAAIIIITLIVKIIISKPKACNNVDNNDSNNLDK